MMTPPFAATILATPPAQVSRAGGVPPMSLANEVGDQQTVLQFAALLAATQPQLPETVNFDPAQIEPGSVSVTRDAALAGLSDDASALVLDVLAVPGATDPSDTLMQLLDLLQDFDIATGGNATQVLATNLAALDGDGMAELAIAAKAPASFVASLLALAGIPDSAHPQPPVHSRPTMRGDNPQTQAAPLIVANPMAGGEMPPVLPLAHAAPVQHPVASPALQRVDMRALVMGALGRAVTGGERDAGPMLIQAFEARATSAAVADIARAPEPALPPSSGFARNLAQQIRSASFTDGHTRIALAPRGLGEIEIDMRPDEAGKLRIVLRAENPAVLQALRGDRDGLLLALADSGAGVEDAELEFEDFNRRHKRQADTPQAFSARQADTDPQEETPIPAQQARSIGEGALDILT